MSGLALAAGLGAVLTVVLVGFVGVVTFNSVVRVRQRVRKAWGNVEVVLQQRHDELPNVVAAVGGAMDFERGVLEDVAALRGAYSPDVPIADQAAASAATTRALRSLFAVVERYPTLRSQDNVMALQREIERLESVLADRRELYNDMAYRYNSAIQQLPGNLFAGLFGWQPVAFFTADQDATTPPRTALGDDGGLA